MKQLKMEIQFVYEYIIFFLGILYIWKKYLVVYRFTTLFYVTSDNSFHQSFKFWFMVSLIVKEA